jgi:uncharacterized protein (TIGR02284 family)
MRVSNLFEPYNQDHRSAARSAMGQVIDACHDAELGYATASDLVVQPLLKQLFADLGAQRHDFARILRAHALWLGVAPSQGQGVGGFIHRSWMEVRCAIDHGAAVSLLSECERGEHSALNKYEHALGIPMPDDLRRIMLDQVGDVRAAHARLDRMRGGS